MEEMSFELICAQKHPEFIDECIELLNSEWPRSKTARLVAIEQGSTERFPTTLLLIDKKASSRGQVVAHCKVSPVSVHHPHACFIESVVVAKSLRGRGIGKIIMDKTEDYVKEREIRTIYLTTHDKQSFYKKLGYDLCEPIVIWGGKVHSPSFINQKLQDHPEDKASNINQMKEENNVPTYQIEKLTIKTKDVNSEITAPPPPPPMTNLTGKISKDSIKLLSHHELKVTMKKDLF